MFKHSKYLLLIFFILMVLIAMILIYSNVNSTDKVVYFASKQAPSWSELIGCVIRGGAVESAPAGSSDSADCEKKTESCQNSARYLCHYR
ncbi:MAG: hypothetical protein AAB575_05225 [Patescibacteria group bacterium]